MSGYLDELVLFLLMDIWVLVMPNRRHGCKWLRGN
jgi:hypothetical protein